jgi:hypothetical protein
VIELLDLELCCQAECALELYEHVLILACLLLKVLDKGSQVICPLTSLVNPPFQAEILLCYSYLCWVGEP